MLVLLHALALAAQLDPRPIRVVDYYSETGEWCAIDATDDEVNGVRVLGLHVVWLAGELRWSVPRI